MIPVAISQSIGAPGRPVATPPTSEPFISLPIEAVAPVSAAASVIDPNAAAGNTNVGVVSGPAIDAAFVERMLKLLVEDDGLGGSARPETTIGDDTAIVPEAVIDLVRAETPVTAPTPAPLPVIALSDAATTLVPAIDTSPALTVALSVGTITAAAHEQRSAAVASPATPVVTAPVDHHEQVTRAPDDRVSLSLSTLALGDVKIDLIKRGDELAVRFGTGSELHRTAVEAAEPVLAAALSPYGAASIAYQSLASNDGQSGPRRRPDIPLRSPDQPASVVTPSRPKRHGRFA